MRVEVLCRLFRCFAVVQVALHASLIVLLFSQASQLVHPILSRAKRREFMCALLIG